MKHDKLVKLVRAARDQKNITAAEAAEKMGISVNYYRLIESGYPTYVSENIAGKLVKGLGVSRKPLFDAMESHNEAARQESARIRERKAKAEKIAGRKSRESKHGSRKTTKSLKK